MLGAPCTPGLDITDALFLLVAFFFLPNTRSGVWFGSSTALRGAGASLGGGGGGKVGGSGAGAGTLGPPPPPKHMLILLDTFG